MNIKGSIPRPTLPDRVVIQETADVLRCLGHPVRLAIIDHLERHGEQTVTEIQEALEIEQATASQHLSLMRDKGILGRRKDGVFVWYRISDERALKVLACIRGG
jgi:DNA-binding transcriptional ArsR family regulator